MFKEIGESASVNIRNIVFNFCWNTLKSCVFKKIEEEKLKDELDSYLSRKLHENYNCTLQEELDLEGLFKYIYADFLDEVHLFLCGSPLERNKAEEEIRNHTKFYAKAYTKIAENRADKIISDILNILCGFYRSHIPDSEKFLFAEAENYITKHTSAELSNAVDTLNQTVTSGLEKISNDLQSKNTLSSSQSLEDKYGSSLLIETCSICPNDGCSTALYTIDQKNRIIPLFKVTVIDTNLSSTEESNLIALCPKCAAKFNTCRTPDKILRLKEIKQNLIKERKFSAISSDITVQDEIRKILKHISVNHVHNDVDLNYIPIPVRKKILNQNVILFSKIQQDVNLFFPDVESAFRELSSEGMFNFERFCKQVRYTYDNLQVDCDDQDTIFTAMTDWLCQITNGDRNICEIIIAYFVQKCEVFHDLTK